MVNNTLLVYSCEFYLYIVTEPGICEEGTVRLMDGVIQQEGRVEVCSNGVWGSVCDQNWDKTDAHIVCQEIGYSELGMWNFLLHISNETVSAV